MHALPPLPWLVADIGGTNMRLGRILQAGAAVQDIVRIATPRNGDLAPALKPYLDGFAEHRPRTAAFAMAGPIIDGHVQLTNSGAHLSVDAAKRYLGLDGVVLANDLEAVATALPRLDGGDVRPLGPDLLPAPGGTRVVLGCGTGCGVGATVWTGTRWHVLASEGGHMPFPVVTDRDRRWREHVANHLKPEARGRVTYDRILCGSGLKVLGDVVAAEMACQSPASPEQIADAACDGTSAVAKATVEHFAVTVGAFAGDLAQVYLASGGIYFAGSLLESLEAFLARPAVRTAFAEKWPHDRMLAAYPLRLIIDPRAPLTGLGEILARSAA